MNFVDVSYYAIIIMCMLGNYPKLSKKRTREHLDTQNLVSNLKFTQHIFSE